MARIAKFFTFMAMLLLSLPSFATINPITQYRLLEGSFGYEAFGTNKATMCAAVPTLSKPGYSSLLGWGGPGANANSCTCYVESVSPQNFRDNCGIFYASQVCPKNSSANGSACVCSAGFEEIEGQCVPVGKCEDKAGDFISKLFRIGWARYYANSSDGSIALEGGGSVTPIPPIKNPPLSACLDGCQAFAGHTGKGPQYADKQTLENGNVEILQSVEFMYTGKSCVQPDPNTDLNGDNPGAPSGGGDNEGDPDKDPDGDGGDKPDKPPKPEDDPPGGDKPHGPGSGGGSTDPNAPNDNDTEPSCGSGTLPPCNTRIDETGTPRDGGVRMSTDRLNNDMTKLDNTLHGIGESSSKNTSWGITPGWFNSGQCQPMKFGTFMHQDMTINHCVAEPYARAVSSFLWIVATFFAIIGMVSRTVGGGSRG